MGGKLCLSVVLLFYSAPWIFPYFLTYHFHWVFLDFADHFIFPWQLHFFWPLRHLPFNTSFFPWPLHFPPKLPYLVATWLETLTDTRRLASAQCRHFTVPGNRVTAAWSTCDAVRHSAARPKRHPETTRRAAHPKLNLLEGPNGGRTPHSTRADWQRSLRRFRGSVFWDGFTSLAVFADRSLGSRRPRSMAVSGVHTHVFNFAFSTSLSLRHKVLRNVTASRS